MEPLTNTYITALRGEIEHKKDACRRLFKHFIICLRFKAVAERRQWFFAASKLCPKTRVNCVPTSGQQTCPHTKSAAFLEHLCNQRHICGSDASVAECKTTVPHFWVPCLSYSLKHFSRSGQLLQSCLFAWQRQYSTPALRCGVCSRALNRNNILVNIFKLLQIRNQVIQISQCYDYTCDDAVICIRDLAGEVILSS